MPIYSVKGTQHFEKLITARSALDAACEIARCTRSMDGYAVTCLELLGKEEGQPHLEKELGVVQEFELHDHGDPGGVRLHKVERPPADTVPTYGKRFAELFPALAAAGRR